MKSKSRTHHSRLELETADTIQHDEHYVVRASFHFDPWDYPAGYPAGYAADALLTLQKIWDAGVEALDLQDREGAQTRVRLEHTSIWLNVHHPLLCDGRPCTVHNRSEHSLRNLPQHWRADRGFMERICSHGVGHPDPDERHSPLWSDDKGVHGCDGCCKGVTFNA